MTTHKPAYLKLAASGELRKRIATAYRRLAKCDLCPRQCGTDRYHYKTGFCCAGLLPEISSHNAHFGEEPPISGDRGSGTIFFTHCNMRCCFCQNYPISQLGHGQEITIEQLAGLMLDLQKKKCHNINLVTGSIYVPQILAALEAACQKGFRLPLVYNCSGYESLETLALLDGIIDIYLPDAKYSDDLKAEQYSQAPRYWQVNQVALKEMHRQVGDLMLDDKDLAVRGLIIRHLVLPQNIAGSIQVLEFIARNISPHTYISVMAQFHPAHKAGDFPELSRRLTQEEYDLVTGKLQELGLTNGWVQEL